MSAESESPRPPPKPADAAELIDAQTYAELRKLARRRLGRPEDNPTLQATVLVHETWLRLNRQDAAWKDRGHFMATAATAMRHILIDAARKKARLRHGGALRRTCPDTLSHLVAPDADDRLVLLDEAISALAQTDAVRADIVVARFFAGRSTEEIAADLGMSERSVLRHWAAAKVWLYRWMQEADKAQT